MKSIYLVFLVFLSMATHAEPTLLCMLERADNNYENGDRKVAVEFQEQPIVFQTRNGRTVAHFEFLFDLMPSYQFTVNILEKRKSDGLEWSHHKVLRFKPDGRVVAEEKANHELTDKEREEGGEEGFEYTTQADEKRVHYYRIDCDAYDRADFFERTPLPSDPLARLRLKKVNGPAYRRVFAREEGEYLATVDAFDLWRQLLKTSGLEADLFREAVADFSRRGWIAEPINPYEKSEMWGLLEKRSRVHCGPFSKEVQCISETVALQMPYYGVVRFRDYDKSSYPAIFLKANILRQARDRSILRLEVIQVEVFHYSPTAGGSSSVSGGRIRP